MTAKYIIWIENGVVSMGEISNIVLDENHIEIVCPVTIVTMQYGVTQEGKLTNPQDTKSVKTKFIPDMMPYIMNGFITSEDHKSNTFTLDITGKCYTLIEDISLPVIEKYKSTVEVFDTAR